MIKRVIILFVIFSLCFCSLAFADDLEPDSTGSSPSAIDVEYDNDLYTLANTLYKIETENGTKAASRTIDDIYNLLVQIFYNQSNGTNEIVVMRQFLNTINTSANGIAVKLTQFYDTINPDYDITGISIYDELNALVTALTTIDPNDGDLTIIETLVYITNALDDLHTDLSAILNSTYSIDNKLVAINTAIVQFKSDLISSISTLNTDINTGFSNVNANLASIISRLQSFENSFNNVNWFSLGTSSLYYSDGTIISSNGNLTNNIIYSYIPYFDSYISMIKVDIPMSGNSTVNRNNNIIDVYITDGTNIKIPINYYVVYDLNRSHTVIYIFNYGGTSNSSSNTFKLYLETKYLSYYSASRGVSYYYITADTIDYYNIYNWLINRQNLQIMDRFNLLYASDDLIASKEEQQPLENQIIEDFTGNGSASATVGDAVNVKQASNAIKNGLNTGANSGVALDYAFGFNNPSGLFVWFSSDTAQYFTLYQPTRGVSDYSSIEWTDELPDHLSILDYKYLQGLDND